MYMQIASSLCNDDNVTIMLSFLLVSCPSLPYPGNGMISCSLGDYGVASYEDTCSYTCNTGYELTGSNTRNCQSDGTWSGNDPTCGRGKFVYITHYVIYYVLMCNDTYFNENVYS